MRKKEEILNELKLIQETISSKILNVDDDNFQETTTTYIYDLLHKAKDETEKEYLTTLLYLLDKFNTKNIVTVNSIRMDMLKIVEQIGDSIVTDQKKNTIMTTGRNTILITTISIGLFVFLYEYSPSAIDKLIELIKLILQ
jgi:hypothetical protein